MEIDLDDHVAGRNQEYLLSKEENHVLLTLLCLDLELICNKIEDNFKAVDNSTS